jgi:hypothetical protein
LKEVNGEILVLASLNKEAVSTKMNQNYRSSKPNKKNPFRIYGYQTRGWTDTTYKFCANSNDFSCINAQGTQCVSQECNKLKDGLKKWPKWGERITQNFDELISYTSKSQ